MVRVVSVARDFLFDFGHEFVHDVLLKLLFASQDPKEVKADSSVEITTGVYNAVCLVICVQDNVIGLAGRIRRTTAETNYERGIACICCNG